MADEEGDLQPTEPFEAAEGVGDGIDVNLDELDDTEFEIPAVATPPTLESILNEHDEHSDGEEHVVITEQEETASVASRGSSEGRRGRSRRPSPSGPRASPSGCIVRHVLLKGLTTQINSASERVGAGSATCACAGGGSVCIGTSQGLVLVFDSSQALRWCLGEATGANSADAGAVSALGLSTCATRLLVGHARGAVFMFDLLTGKLLRTLSDAHPPATAVLHLKFTEGTSSAVLGDAGGSVFELSFTRNVLGARGCASRCLFSGSRGEVVALEPLPHPLQLLAMATLSKAIVVQLRPRTRLLFSHPLPPSSPPSLPLLAWQCVVIQVADGRRVIDPVLAFGRHDTFYFYQASVDATGRTRLVPLQRTQVSYQMLSLQWLNPRTLAVLDTREQLHVLDVRTQTELEVVDLSDVRLVYASSHFKALATGGNVSPALAAAGEKACYHSVVACGQQLLVLGTRSVHALSVRPWTERIGHLVRQRRFLAAIDLCQAFHDDKAKAVVGLKGTKAQRKQLIKQKMFEVLEAFVDEMLSKEASEQELQEVWNTASNLCVQHDRLDLLFERFYESASDRLGAEGSFLDSLQPLILNDQLRAPPPAVLQRLVNHLETTGNFQALEACLVHVEVGSMDVHQAMKLCWQHNLYDAIVYIHTSGMLDFETPFTELATVLQNALATGKQLSDEVVRLGNVLLVFVSCCLAGRAYPHGDIPAEIQPQAKHELLKSLTAVHSRNAPDSELPHPYLRALLQFDTREFLNVLALAFEEPEFTSELGLRQRQRIVDILLQIMVHGQGFSVCQVGALFTFLARQLARPGSALVVEPALFGQVIDFLTTPDTSVTGAQHEERQQALLELLRAAADLTEVPPEQLLEKARAAKFFRVCELLYERQRDYESILECYLLDPLRRPQAFAYLRNILGNSGYLTPEKANSLLLRTVKDLVELDNKKTGQLMLCHAPQLVDQVMTSLEPHPEALLAFLQGLFLYKETHARGEEIPVEAHERLLELLCQLEPNQVAAHLAAGHGCRLDSALEICRKYGHIEGEGALLEQKGDISGAFELLMKQLQIELEKAEEEDTPEIWQRALDRLASGVRLCQRGGGALLDQTAREALFFPLLRMLAERRRNSKLNESQQKAYSDMCQMVLSGMVGYVALPAALQLLLEDPHLARGRFGELKHLLLSMLASAAEEERLLATTRRLVGVDLHARLDTLLKGARRPLAPHPAGAPVPASAPPLCAHCDRPLNAAPPALVFRCGHAFHKCCAPDGDGDPECLLCHPGPRAALPEGAAPQVTEDRAELVLRRRAAAAPLNSTEDPLVLNLSPPPGHAFLQGLF